MTPRIAAKTDENQAQIVEELREEGRSVLCLHMVGGGCGDILIGYQGVNYLIEIKMPGKRHRLTPAEKKFHATWKGQIDIAESIEEIWNIIGGVVVIEAHEWR